MAHVLIVDDNQANRQLLQEIILREHPDYTIATVANGKACLDFMQHTLPDIVLLDSMMPKMNGIEVCQKLKGTVRTQDIPVIFVAAVDTVEQKVAAFRAGAADYIVKPITSEETHARIEAHLAVKRYHDELRTVNSQLQETQDALVYSAKMSVVGSLAAGVAHEFNNILSMLSGYVQLCGQKNDLSYIHSTMHIFEELVTRGQDIVEALNDFSRKTEGREKQCADIAEIIQKDIMLMKHILKEEGVEVVTKFDAIPPVMCYPGQLSQVFINIIKNAIEAMRGVLSRRLTVELGVCNTEEKICRMLIAGQQDCISCVVVRFRDTGRGVDVQNAQKVFEPFVTTKGAIGGGDVSTPGTGLGLSISYGIMRRHDGDIFFEQTGPEGTTVTVIFPVIEAVSRMKKNAGDRVAFQ